MTFLGITGSRSFCRGRIREGVRFMLLTAAQLADWLVWGFVMGLGWNVAAWVISRTLGRLP